MKCGSMVFATDSGLGILAKSFYDAGIITHPLIVRHAHHSTHGCWYPPSVNSIPIRPLDVQTAREHCTSVDVMLFFETPFEWHLIDWCWKHGVKTALMPMHECMPRLWPYMPDLILCPSELEYALWPDEKGRSVRSVHIPIPVNVPHRRRERAQVYVHNAGHGGLRGRNGTGELLDAMKYVRSPLKLIVRSQKLLQWQVDDPRVEVRVGSVPYDRLWEDGGEGDVFVFPEKFNGLSLPLQEARASGMLVMATHRFPMTEWLPHEPLIPARGVEVDRIGPNYPEFDKAVIDPQDIARVMDEWYNKDISDYSESGRVWAESMSWEALAPRYHAALDELCG